MAGSKSPSAAHSERLLLDPLHPLTLVALCPCCCVSRLLKEYREIKRAAEEAASSGVAEAIQLRPVSESNLYRWTAAVLGPCDTPFAHHRFSLSLSIPLSYPHSPPAVVFTTPVAHPNIHPRTGEICLDILKEQWTPVWTIESVCRAVVALLAGGDASSPLNCDCGNLIRGGDWRGYWSIARMWTLEHAQRVEEDTEEEKRGDGWKNHSGSGSSTQQQQSETERKQR